MILLVYRISMILYRVTIMDFLSTFFSPVARSSGGGRFFSNSPLFLPSLARQVEEDSFLILSEGNSVSIPNMLLPRMLDNHGNYIISLGQLTKWLATKAEVGV